MVSRLSQRSVERDEPLEAGSVELRHGGGGEAALEQRAQLVGLAQRVDADPAHDRAAVGGGVDQALGLQLAHRLAHGHA